MSITKYLQVGLFLIPAMLFMVCTVSVAKDRDDPSFDDDDKLGTYFIRGDVDGDGVFNAIPDAFYMLHYGFGLGPEPPCLEAADTDDDGVFNALTDVLYLLNAGFHIGPPPAAPFPACGVDPLPARSLGCDAGIACP